MRSRNQTILHADYGEPFFEFNQLWVSSLVRVQLLSPDSRSNSTKNTTGLRKFVQNKEWCAANCVEAQRGLMHKQRAIYETLQW